jgi:hypothetical protein
MIDHHQRDGDQQDRSSDVTFGGGRGIRTHDGCNPIAVFKTVSGCIAACRVMSLSLRFSVFPQVRAVITDLVVSARVTACRRRAAAM